MWIPRVSRLAAFLVVSGLVLWHAGRYGLLEGSARALLLAVAGTVLAEAIDRGIASLVARRRRRY